MVAWEVIPTAHSSRLLSDIPLLSMPPSYTAILACSLWGRWGKQGPGGSAGDGWSLAQRPGPNTHPVLPRKLKSLCSPVTEHSSHLGTLS